jgi:cell shape-determining protein MreC
MTRAKVSVIARLQKLLNAVEDNADSFPDVRTHKETLRNALARVDQAQSRRTAHRAEAQSATQEIEVMLGVAKEAASRLQAAALLVLGRRNAELSKFQVKPLR